MPCWLASTPVANVDQATGEIDGSVVSSGRKTPCAASFSKFGSRPSRHELAGEPRVHAVETQDHDPRCRRLRVRVADREQPIHEADRPGGDDPERQRERRQQHEHGAAEGEARAGADVGVRLAGGAEQQRREQGPCQRLAPISLGYHAGSRYGSRRWLGMIGHQPERKRRRARALLLGSGLALACGAAPSERLAQAREELDIADYAGALDEAEAGLRGGPDAQTAWGLELARLEAQARAGRGDAANEQLRQLTTRHPERMPPSQYAATADQLRAAGDGPGAIQALDLGLRQHPGDALIERLIGDAKSGEVAPAELEMLRSLGYVE